MQFAPTSVKNIIQQTALQEKFPKGCFCYELPVNSLHPTCRAERIRIPEVLSGAVIIENGFSIAVIIEGGADIRRFSAGDKAIITIGLLADVHSYVVDLRSVVRVGVKKHQIPDFQLW